jgi:Ca2+-dependent lipid-binding protein
MDNFGLSKSDPFATVEIEGNRAQTCSTAVVYNSLDPVWDESFELVVVDEDKNLSVTLFDEDKGGAVDVMGEVRFTISELRPYEELERWYPLARARYMKKGLKCKGDVSVRHPFALSMAPNWLSIFSQRSN